MLPAQQLACGRRWQQVPGQRVSLRTVSLTMASCVHRVQLAGNNFTGPFPAKYALTNTSFISVMSMSVCSVVTLCAQHNALPDRRWRQSAAHHRRCFAGTLLTTR